jgi:hypothetical protein
LCTAELKEVVCARGNPNVSATHNVTLEITKETTLSRKGDCVIAVSADKAIDDLSLGFKRFLQKNDTRLEILIEVDGVSETVNAFGDSRLILAHPTDMVIRRSAYISGRTLAIGADKAACDLSRILVRKLKDPEQQVRITLNIRTH